MMDPKLLLCAFYLDRVQPVRFLFQINLVRYFQCVVTAKRLFVSLWVVIIRRLLRRGYWVTRWCVWLRPKADIWLVNTRNIISTGMNNDK